jgi:hypothetical protein
MLKYKTIVNSQIAVLITTMRSLRFGEMYGVEIDLDGDDLFPLEVSKNEYDLVQEIHNGLQHIDVLTVHNGEPVRAEVDEKTNGFRCRKKIKFPTVQTED